MKIFVSDLQEKQTVQTVFLVKEKSRQMGKNGKAYVAFKLGDKTGDIEGRIWDNVEELAEKFDVDDFVSVKGFVQAFQGRNQLVVSQIESVMTSDISLADYLPASERDPKEMFQELTQILEQIKNPYIKQLVFNTLNDPNIQPLVLACPAAKTIHHAYIGGLLEHTLSICHVMKFMASHYKSLDLDLLLFGAVFHDIGKIWELSFDTSLGYTDVGRLVGHIPLGSELVEKKSSEIPNFPYDLKNKCKHIILSHHGRLEFGSPKRPKFLEALVVSQIDEIDSRINQLEQFLKLEKKQGDNKWSRYHKDFDRYFYLE